MAFNEEAFWRIPTRESLAARDYGVSLKEANERAGLIRQLNSWTVQPELTSIRVVIRIRQMLGPTVGRQPEAFQFKQIAVLNNQVNYCHNPKSDSAIELVSVTAYRPVKIDENGLTCLDAFDPPLKRWFTSRSFKTRRPRASNLQSKLVPLTEKCVSEEWKLQIIANADKFRDRILVRESLTKRVFFLIKPSGV